jgi:hypothetical protein|tara:strand:- start:26 stop:685 length:660 start_codon:yes stop_codon:yes gene_type:complete
MRNYISERVSNSTNYFNFSGIDVYIDDDIENDLDPKKILVAIEKRLPRSFFRKLESIHLGNYEKFKERQIDAIYDDNKLYISNQQDNYEDLLDDVIHEIGHHVETLYIEDVYGDEEIKKEFLNKRSQLEFELRSEGLWTTEYDFKNVKFDMSFDDFLYKRVGKRLLGMVTSGIFIRPYASVSLREYFATGFEAYYLNDKDVLSRISPALYKKIDHLNTL